MLAKRYAYDGKPAIKLNDYQKKVKAEIELKVKNRIYKSNKVNCVICNSDKFELLSEKDRCGFYCPIVICRNCGLVQINPRFDKAAYDDYYKTAYRTLANIQSLPPEKVFLDQYYRAPAVYNYILPNINVSPQQGQVLEIGCSTGGMLQYFKERKWNTLGIDINEKYISFGRDSYGLDLKTVDLSELKLSQPADIIILSHVLEHFWDPKQELSLVKSFMHKKSVIYIEVPGIKNIVFNCYDLDFLLYVRLPHIYNFTLDSLKNMLGKEGFSLVCGDEVIKSIFQISNEEQSIKNVYLDTLKYLKRQETVRKYLLITPYKIMNAIHTVIRWVIERAGLFNLAKKLYYKIIKREEPKKEIDIYTKNSFYENS